MEILIAAMLYILGYCACLVMFIFTQSPGMIRREAGIAGSHAAPEISKNAAVILSIAALFWFFLLPVSLIDMLAAQIEVDCINQKAKE